jgi:hypothetical protein
LRSNQICHVYSKKVRPHLHFLLFPHALVATVWSWGLYRPAHYKTLLNDLEAHSDLSCVKKVSLHLLFQLFPRIIVLLDAPVAPKWCLKLFIFTLHHLFAFQITPNHLLTCRVGICRLFWSKIINKYVNNLAEIYFFMQAVVLNVIYNFSVEF